MQGLPHMDNAAFHVFIKFPQLTSKNQCNGPLLPPLQPLGSVCVLTVISLARVSPPQVDFAAGSWVSRIRAARGD